MMLRAAGNYVWDDSGNKWLDMRSGIMNVSLGHNSRPVRDALRDVLECGLINSYKNYSRNYYRFKELMGEYEPRYRWQVFNTGAEAIDRALQVISVKLGRMPRIAAIRGGFHGKTMPLSIMRHPDQPWGNPFDIQIFGLDDEVIPDFDVVLYEPFMNLIGTTVDEARLREVADAREAYMIADEMITGFLRIGKRFANEHADIVVSAKGLSQGVPLSVVGFCPDLAGIDIPVEWSTTASGNNLSMTVGLYVLEYLMVYEDVLLEACMFNQDKMRSMGMAALGSLGFLQLEHADVFARDLHNNHILATSRDGLLRVGPSFVMKSEDYTRFERVLEDYYANNRD